MTKPTLLILAAGMGSRYGGLKQLDGVGPSGETIMDYSVYDAIQAGFGEVVFVIRKHFRSDFEERIRSRYGESIKFNFVEQELDNIPVGFNLNPERSKPWGTGHAIMMAAQAISTPFAVINADDYYGQDSFKILGDFLRSVNNKSGEYAMVGFQTLNTLSEAGKVSRGICSSNKESLLTSVEEHHNIIAEERGGETKVMGDNSSGERVEIDKMAPVSMNMWGFTSDYFTLSDQLFIEFLNKNIDNLTSEFYIPFVVNRLISTGKANCKVLSTPNKWFGVTFREDRERVVESISKLVSEGKYPTPLFKL
jgi:choline kinase